MTQGVKSLKEGQKRTIAQLEEIKLQYYPNYEK